MIRRPPRSTLFPSRRSSDLGGTEYAARPLAVPSGTQGRQERPAHTAGASRGAAQPARCRKGKGDRKSTRLNSSHPSHLVCRLLLEKKKKHTTHIGTQSNSPR